MNPTLMKATPLRVLVAEAGTAVRDHIVAGLRVFDGITADLAQGPEILDLAARKDYDFVVYGIATSDPQELQLLEQLLAMEKGPDLLVVARDAIAKKLASERPSPRIFSTIRRPIEPLQFYRTVSRLRRRLQERRD
ncbi:MAG: hypothetical protein AB1486_19950 [Planctomycetota bacterium]